MLNALGVTILVAGLSTAVSLWLAQDRIDSQRDAGDADVTAPLSPEDSRRYTHDVEVYYGQTGLLMEKWRRWCEEWTHGKPLAEVIGVTAVISAGGVFYLARNRRRPTGVAGPGTTQRSPAASQRQGTADQ